jgi:hypothetical protein
MTALTWDNVGDRIYEIGLDRGVLFFPEGGGVAWNGLTSIDYHNETDVEPVYFDGIKFNDLVFGGAFAATLRAFTYPDEFLRFMGVVEDQTGVLITGQQPEQFHMCFRTQIHSDVSIDIGYKIHILWNLTAVPQEIEHETLRLDTEPIEFEWELTAVPEYIDRFKPTAYIIIDTRKVDPFLVRDLEDILYGDEDSDPTLPSLKGLSTFIRKWGRLIITDNADGTWTATSDNPDYPITMLDADTFEITSDTAVYLDADTYEISSTEKNEEDIWLP